MKIWIDVFNGPHVHFFQNATDFLPQLGGSDLHLTARDYYPIPQLLNFYKIKAAVVGQHGGESLYGKLVTSTERVLALAEHVQTVNTEKPFDLLIHKHSVEAARVAWGLGIPSIAFLDNEIMSPQNMLVCPLANVLITPMCIEMGIIRSFSPNHLKILQFDGVSEVAHVAGYEPSMTTIDRLGLDTTKPIVVFRSAPMLAAYNSNSSLAEVIIDQIERQVPDVQIVHLKRSGEKAQSENVIDARSLSYYADLVISGGGTMTREAALLGTNAITYFNQPLAVDKYLIDKGLLKSFPGKDILQVDWCAEITARRKRPNLNDFEHPFSLLAKAVNLL